MGADQSTLQQQQNPENSTNTTSNQQQQQVPNPLSKESLQLHQQQQQEQEQTPTNNNNNNRHLSPEAKKEGLKTVNAVEAATAFKKGLSSSPKRTHQQSQEEEAVAPLEDSNSSTTSGLEEEVLPEESFDNTVTRNQNSKNNNQELETEKESSSLQSQSPTTTRKMSSSVLPSTATAGVNDDNTNKNHDNKKNKKHEHDNSDNDSLDFDGEDDVQKNTKTSKNTNNTTTAASSPSATTATNNNTSRAPSQAPTNNVMTSNAASPNNGNHANNASPQPVNQQQKQQQQNPPSNSNNNHQHQQQNRPSNHHSSPPNPNNNTEKKRKVLHGDHIEYKYPSGSVYVGSFRDGKLHGFGRYTYHPSRDIYEGEWQNDMKHGRGVYTYDGGDRYTGEWHNGKKHGKGTYAFQSGDEYVGGWLDDKIHGFGTFLVARNNNRYEGEWKESYRHGTGVLRSGNGNIYEGSWSKGKEDGPGVLVQPNGKIYAGHWKQGQMDGKGILFEGGVKYLVENIGGFVTSKDEVPEHAVVDPAWNVANKLYNFARDGKVGNNHNNNAMATLNSNNRGFDAFGSLNASGNIGGGGGDATVVLETKLQNCQVEKDLYQKKYNELLALRGKSIPTPDGADDLVTADEEVDDMINNNDPNLNDIVDVLKRTVSNYRSQRNAERLSLNEVKNTLSIAKETIHEFEFRLHMCQKQIQVMKAGGAGTDEETKNQMGNMQKRIAELETKLRNGGGSGQDSNDANSNTAGSNAGQLQAKIELLETEKAKLQKSAEELQKVRTESINLTKELGELQRKNAELEKELRVKDQRLEFDNKQANNDLSAANEMQQNEIRFLYKQLDEMKQENESIREKSKAHIEKLRAAEGLAAQAGEFQAQLELMRQNRQKESAVADRRSEELEKYKKENATLARQLEEARATLSRANASIGGSGGGAVSSSGSPNSLSNLPGLGGAGGGAGREQSVISDLETKLAQIEKEKADREKKEKKKLKKMLGERDEALAKLTVLQLAQTNANVQLHSMVESKILTVGRFTKDSSSANTNNNNNNNFKQPQILPDQPSTICIPSSSASSSEDAIASGSHFSLDVAFPAEAKAEAVTASMKSLCQQVAQGFNCSVITYGAMKSGKTSSLHNILPLLLRDVLEPCNAKSSSHEVSVSIQSLELSVDGLHDLLSTESSSSASSSIEILKDAYNNVIFQNCSSQQCPNVLAFRDIASTFEKSCANRRRPRSHILYVVNCAFTHRVTNVSTFGKFLVADLAGMGSLGSQDDVDSAAYVNSSIMKLQQVVEALTTQGQTAVPYKEDKLTMALSDTLGGNSRTAMIIHVPVTPIADEDDGGTESTHQSLACGVKAREIQNALVKRSESNEVVALRRALVNIDPAAVPNMNVEVGTIRE